MLGLAGLGFVPERLLGDVGLAYEVTVVRLLVLAVLRTVTLWPLVTDSCQALRLPFGLNSVTIDVSVGLCLACLEVIELESMSLRLVT